MYNRVMSKKQAVAIFGSCLCILGSSFLLASESAYNEPLQGLSVEEKQEFELGKSLFERFWVPSPSSTTASDGLGPLFNARSCHSCHMNSGRGHAPKEGESGNTIPSFFIRLGRTYPEQNKVISHYYYPKVGDKIYGHQFQTLSSTDLLPEGNYQLQYEKKIETLSDGKQVTLKKPIIHWTALNYSEFEQTTGFSTRVTPALVGMGLLDAIPDSVILKNADPEDIDRNGISGKANWIKSGKSQSLGKFGFKASVPTVSQQNQLAFNGDIGLSTPQFPSPNGDCTEYQTDCIAHPNGNSPHLDNLEVSHKQVELVDLFVVLSSPPAMRNLANPFFKKGKVLFENAGCSNCHIPKMTTDNLSPHKALRNRTFYPFTDLLLHDMGPGLSSGFPEYSAAPAEWRTTPLWGLGLSEQVSGRIGFLHDGRASTLEEAILWHGGEAQSSQKSYKQLTEKDRQTLIRFLESL